MSTDWHVHCLDCGDTHRFDDANHRENLMALFCKHAAAIGGLAPLIAEAGVDDVQLKAGYGYGTIDAGWFAKHATHRLAPIDEYGRLTGKCIHDATRGACTVAHRCKLDHDHTGDHE